MADRTTGEPFGPVEETDEVQRALRGELGRSRQGYGFSQGTAHEQLTAMANNAGELLTEFQYDETEDRMVVRYSQDVEPFIERAKELHWDPSYDGYTPSRDLRHVATIPNHVYMRWLTEEGIDAYRPDHWPRVKRKLNDPEYLYLRTGGGRL